MKVNKQIGLIAAVLCGIAALEARAQPILAGTEPVGNSFVLFFDENGNGQISINGFLPFGAHPGVLGQDPTQGNLPALMYTVNAAGLVANGDVRIYDDFLGGHLSDVLRFTDANGNLVGQKADRMFFYSDDVGYGALADTGIPAALLPNDGGGILEVNDSFTWAPGGAAPNVNVYNGISVPEPASFGLMILGGLLGLRRLFWQKQS